MHPLHRCTAWKHQAAALWGRPIPTCLPTLTLITSDLYFDTLKGEGIHRLDEVRSHCLANLPGLAHMHLASTRLNLRPRTVQCGIGRYNPYSVFQLWTTWSTYSLDPTSPVKCSSTTPSVNQAILDLCPRKLINSRVPPPRPYRRPHTADRTPRLRPTPRSPHLHPSPPCPQTRPFESPSIPLNNLEPRQRDGHRPTPLRIQSTITHPKTRINLHWRRPLVPIGSQLIIEPPWKPPEPEPTPDNARISSVARRRKALWSRNSPVTDKTRLPRTHANMPPRRSHKKSRAGCKVRLHHDLHAMPLLLIRHRREPRHILDRRLGRHAEVAAGNHVVFSHLHLLFLSSG